jgi:uncharacterized protein YjiS (DUF1127 family)
MTDRVTPSRASSRPLFTARAHVAAALGALAALFSAMRRSARDWRDRRAIKRVIRQMSAAQLRDTGLGACDGNAPVCDDWPTCRIGGLADIAAGRRPPLESGSIIDPWSR